MSIPFNKAEIVGAMQRGLMDAFQYLNRDPDQVDVNGLLTHLERIMVRAEELRDQNALKQDAE